ncbi:MAG: translation initiation factor IF-2 N-terminal domain-containing protein, partial [Pyrinomonadaceae bacterium]
MTVHSKIRIYDLAKELKLESKRLIEEVRREGVDVSVPSNTISKELAEKIRNKYFPKKEPTAPRAVRVVKKAPRVAGEGEAGDDIHASVPPSTYADAGAMASDDAADAAVGLAPEPQAEEPDAAGGPGKAVRVLKKLAPAARAEQPATSSALPAATQIPSAELPTDAPDEVEASAPHAAPETVSRGNGAT